MKNVVGALGAVIALTAGSAGSVAAKDVVIHAGTLIDGVARTARSQVSILIHDDRITEVKPGFVSPAGAEVIDLSKSTVLPGLIDTHVHLSASHHGGDPIRNAVVRTSFDDIIDGVGNVRATLLAGFTSARDVGGDTRVVVALKKAINAGTIPGPRLWVSGYPLGPSDGHGDPLNGLNEEIFKPNDETTTIDSPEAARKAVRVLRRQGADLIKIMPSGGVMSIGDDPTLQLMTDDEIKAVVDTAHSLNMKVAAHAHGEVAINHAISLGVDSIEHGSYADAASYKLFKAGLPPMEAIVTATSNAADLIGDSADIGSVQAGRFADIIAVSGDPLKDVKALETVSFVMKGGVVVKIDGKPVG